MDPENLYYYQLRYDSWDSDHFTELEKDYLNIVGYVYGLERKADGTKHIQAMFLNEFKLSQNEKTKLRLCLKTKIKNEFNLQEDDDYLKNSVAISDAKYPHALLDYCVKSADAELVHVHLTAEQAAYIKSLPLNSKNQFKDKIHTFIEKLKDKKLSRKEFYTEVCQFYILSDRSLPRKQQLLTLAVKYNYLTFSEYLDEINLINCPDWEQTCPNCNDYSEGEITT